MQQANVTPLHQGRCAPARPDPAARLTGLFGRGGRRRIGLQLRQLLRVEPAAKVAKLRLLSTLRVPAATTGACSMGADATPPPSLPAKHACTTRSPRDRIRFAFQHVCGRNVFYTNLRLLLIYASYCSTVRELYYCGLFS